MPIEKYFHHWYIIKLRFIEARRIAFSDRSIFGFENLCQQQRKIIEGIAQSWVLIEMSRHELHSRNILHANNPVKIFNFLNKRVGFRFPDPARITEVQKRSAESPAKFELSSIEDGLDSAKSLLERYAALHPWNHSFGPFNSLPIPSDIAEVMTKNYRAVAIENQRMWNQYCQHRVYLDRNWFHISLGSIEDVNIPTLIQVENEKVLDSVPNTRIQVKLITGWEACPDFSKLKDSI